MSAALKRIAFAGIGNMGWPMAANLVKAGFDVTVCDVVPGRAASFATETGAKAAATLAEAAAGADCVVIIVPTSKQVGEAVEAMLPSLKSGITSCCGFSWSIPSAINYGFGLPIRAGASAYGLGGNPVGPEPGPPGIELAHQGDLGWPITLAEPLIQPGFQGDQRPTTSSR
ncbi:MAG: NAD(P)-binding domain-containing protein [Alphaproteobacteria bacterium]|nr:NAD(P)-binding domain-containing protein [Alphaproteobacteria bacterium]